MKQSFLNNKSRTVNCLCLIILFWVTIILTPREASAVSLIPAMQEFQVAKGEMVAGTVSLENDEDLIRLYYINKADFKAGGDRGQAEIIFENNNQENEGYSLSRWIRLPVSQVILKPQDRAELTFTIEVPEDVEPGGHYGAILFSEEPEYLKNGSGVSVAGRIASLILVRVEGEAKESIVVKSFGTDKNKRFFETLPVNFIIDLANEGNVHLKPLGQIELTDLLGNKVQDLDALVTHDGSGQLVNRERVNFLPVNYTRNNILPDSRRKFEAVWTKSELQDAEEQSGGFWQALQRERRSGIVGRFRSKLQLSYGESTKVINVSGPVIWVVPWRLILIILITTAGIILLVRWLIRRLIYPKAKSP